MKKITATAFSSGMRGGEKSFDKNAGGKGAVAKQTRKIMSGTATGGAGETAASDSEGTGIKVDQTVPLPAIFSSGMRGNEKMNSDGSNVADAEAAASPAAEVAKVESGAGVLPADGTKNSGVHNSAEIVSSDADHITFKIPRKVLMGQPAKPAKKK